MSVTAMEAWLSSGSVMCLLDILSEIKVGPGGDLALRVREVAVEHPGISVLTLVIGPKVGDVDAVHLTRLAPIDVLASIIRTGGAEE